MIINDFETIPHFREKLTDYRTEIFWTTKVGLRFKKPINGLRSFQPHRPSPPGISCPASAVTQAFPTRSRKARPDFDGKASLSRSNQWQTPLTTGQTPAPR